MQLYGLFRQTFVTFSWLCSWKYILIWNQQHNEFKRWLKALATETRATLGKNQTRKRFDFSWMLWEWSFRFRNFRNFVHCFPAADKMHYTGILSMLALYYTNNGVTFSKRKPDMFTVMDCSSWVSFNSLELCLKPHEISGFLEIMKKGHSNIKNLKAYFRKW